MSNDKNQGKEEDEDQSEPDFDVTPPDFEVANESYDSEQSEKYKKDKSE
ncbi:hypothetical protein [Alcanivorax xiamenensis]|nr:hypothetical protein [Alcanivorax xiamenensis]